MPTPICRSPGRSSRWAFRRVGPGLLPADHRGPRGPPLRAAVRADARPCSRARQRPRRSRTACLRRDAGPPRHRPAWLLPPAGRPQLPVGHQERARAAAAGAVDPRSAASRHRRRAARSLRAARHPRLAAAAKPGDPRRLRAGQRASRRPRPRGRHHRLRRHRSQRTGDRSGIVAVLRAAHPPRGRRLSLGPDPDRRLPVARRAGAARARAAPRPAGGAALYDRLDQRLAGDQLPGERRVHPGVGSRLLDAAEPIRPRRHRDGGAGAGRREASRRQRGAREAPPAGAGLGDHGTDLFRAGARAARRGPVAVRCRRAQAARRLQQRPGRRPLPPAGDRGRRPPDPDAEHARPLSVRAADGPRRAADRRHARRQRPGHGGRGQLG